MTDTVAKQLQFSPVAFTPPGQQQTVAALFNLQQVQQRLDARPDWGSSSGGAGQTAAGSGSAGSQKGFRFKVPSDDEDDAAMGEEVDLAPSAAAAAAGTGGGSFNSASHHGQSQQQLQQLQQQQVFVFSTVPSSQPSPVESMLWEHTRKLQAYALREADSKQQQLHSQLHQVEQQLVQQLQEVQHEVARKRARAAAADEEYARQRMQERHRKLQEVQLQQQALQAAHATALQEAHKQQAEAEAKRQAAAAAAAAAEKQRQEEEARKQQAAAAAKAAAEAQAKAAADKAQHQHQQQQSAAATAAAAAGSGSTPQQQGPAPPAAVRASEGALECASQLRAKLEGAEASAAVLINKPELKAARRAVERKITMWVSQISGTQQQVRDKSLQLIELIKSCNTPEEQNLAFVTLCNRMLSQCEVQVLRIGSFAFPLAYVCVAVGAAVPQFMELLLAKLQQACPLLVPQQGKRAPGASDADYFQSLGYKLVDDPKKEGAQRLESADEFVARMTAMVLLFASIVQTESAGNPLPLSFGWTWMARCLNSMPPNRSCAAALIAFLSHAGYRMAGVYGRQFHKMLGNLAQHYLPALEAKAEKDKSLRAVATRLHTYISARSYLKEPDGRRLKKVDESQTTHA